MKEYNNKGKPLAASPCCYIFSISAKVMSKIDTIGSFSLLFAEIYCKNGEIVL